jgi:hypothetical protein
MKAKRKAKNWRKRAEEAEKSEKALRRRYEASVNGWDTVLNDYEIKFRELHGQIEVGDALLDKQRERLIRLTEIKNLGEELTKAIRGVWIKNVDACQTYELDGTAWVKGHGFSSVILARKHYENAIAALEVDTAIPQKGARP